MKILVVDDHALFREGLMHLLAQLGGDIQVKEASDYDSAVASLEKISDFDIMLLDLNMPARDGFSVLAFARENYKTLPVIVLSASKQLADMQRVIDQGAMGFIPKESSGELMLNAVRVVLAGGIYLPAEMMKASSKKAASNVITLTPRQLEVLTMLAKGDSNKLIAGALGITEATTKMHISGIFKALKVSNRTQAVLKAQETGLKLL